MLFAFLAAAAAALPTATPVDIRSWFTADDYPAEAAKKGVEGVVTFEVDVDATGKPTACRIASSSGSELLDKATCDIVMKRAQFLPARRHGKPVAGRYSKRTNWQLEDALDSGWFAAILDFSKDPAHPICSVESSGAPGGPSCQEALRKLGSEGVENGVTKLAVMMSFASGNQQPFAGKPEWGHRVSFVAIELFSPQQGSKAACIMVAQEGPPLDGDPCARYADGSSLSEADKRSPNKAHIEQSLFEVAPSRAAASQGRCKNGDSAAEAKGCV